MKEATKIKSIINSLGPISEKLTNEQKVQFCIDQHYNNDEKLYVYMFNEKSVLIGEDGFIEPNYEFDGSFNNLNEITIPASTFVVISNKVL